MSHEKRQIGTISGRKPFPFICPKLFPNQQEWKNPEDACRATDTNSKHWCVIRAGVFRATHFSKSFLQQLIHICLFSAYWISLLSSTSNPVRQISIVALSSYNLKVTLKWMNGMSKTSVLNSSVFTLLSFLVPQNFETTFNLWSGPTQDAVPRDAAIFAFNSGTYERRSYVME